MRSLLLTFLLATVSAHGAEYAVPEKKKDDPSSPTNKVDQWEATKGNKEMFLGEITQNQFENQVLDGPRSKNLGEAATGAGAALKQSDSMILYENVLTNCVDTALNGRKDELCKSSPSHPECIGLNVTTENALCNTPGYKPKDDTECKQTNLKDYTSDEWIAFGEQYYSGMQGCGETKMKTASSSTMASLTDMLANPVTKGPVDYGVIPTSGISGTVPATTDGTTLKVKPTLSSLNIPDDGSARLGYENGEVLKRAEKGEPFYTVVMDSPVVEDIKPKNRALLERGLSEPNLVLDQARMNGRLRALGEDPKEYAEATDPKNIPPELPAVDGLDDLSDMLGTGAKRSAKANSGASQYVAKAAPPPVPAAAAETASPPPSPADAPRDPGIGRVQKEAALLAAVANSSVSSTALTPAADLLKPSEPKSAAQGGRALMLHERIAMLEAAAKELKKESAGRGPASLPALDAKGNAGAQASAEDLEALSLFQRVSSTYRKKSLLLRTLESAAGRDLRSADAPKFFNEL